MQKAVQWLLFIGGVNWLLVGIFNKDLFGFLGMEMDTWIPKIVYILVGLAALMTLKPKSSAPQM